MSTPLQLDDAAVARGECEHGSLRRKCSLCERDDVIMELRAALAAADRLAHQYPYSPAHEAYWRARGGHDVCTVCAADRAAYDREAFQLRR